MINYKYFERKTLLSEGVKHSILYNLPTHSKSQKSNVAIGGSENAP